MKADNIRAGMVLGRRTVARASNGVGAYRVGKSQWSEPSRLIVFTDGSRKAFPLGTDVDVRSGWSEPLPAGGVRSKNVKTPPKVDASPRRWRGESVHGKLTTREHDLITATNMFDVGRVNGKVGADRNGVGSTRLTGKSF